MDENKVKIISEENDKIALIEDEAYKLNSDELIIHECEDDMVYLITADEQYITRYDENGWLVTSEDISDSIVDKLNNRKRPRYAEAEANGFPIKFDVEFRSDNALYDSAWRNGIMRPSGENIKNIKNKIDSVTLTVNIDKNGNLTIIDVDTWPDEINKSL